MSKQHGIRFIIAELRTAAADSAFRVLRKLQSTLREKIRICGYKLSKTFFRINLHSTETMIKENCNETLGACVAINRVDQEDHNI